jgi:serine/threonine protein kinase
LAKFIDQSAGADDLSRSGELVGTIRYMAPEQFHGQCDERSDIYSLGLTLYEMAALQPAFSAESPSQLIAKITQEPPLSPRRVAPTMSVDLETIILKSIERDPTDRYESAAAMAGDLNCFLQSRPIAARRCTPWGRASRWGRRNPVTAALSALVLLLSVTTVTVIVALLGGSGQDSAPPNPMAGEYRVATTTENQTFAQSGELDASEAGQDDSENAFGPPDRNLPGIGFGPPDNRLPPGERARGRARFENDPYGPPGGPRGRRGGPPEGPPRRRGQPPRDRRPPPVP